MWRGVVVAAAAIVGAFVLSASQVKADTIVTYDISGTETFSGPSFDPTIADQVSGTITLDYTTGFVQSAGIPDPMYTTFRFSTAFEDPVAIASSFALTMPLIPCEDCYENFRFTFTDPTDGIFTSGSVGMSAPYANTQGSGCGDKTTGICDEDNIISFSGSLSLPPSPTPIGPTFPLFASSLGMLGLLQRRLRRTV